MRPLLATLSLAAFLGVGSLCPALTLEELRAKPNLTPQSFAKLFARFHYERHQELLPPEIFLATETGDCDDFATLAAQILGERGYTTRLISVRVPGDIHVVCYVEETRCYLDFNNRGYFFKTVSSEGSLEEIARKVAKSLDSNSWTTASEFTCEEGLKRLIRTVHSNPSLAALR